MYNINVGSDIADSTVFNSPSSRNGARKSELREAIENALIKGGNAFCEIQNINKKETDKCRNIVTALNNNRPSSNGSRFSMRQNSNSDGTFNVAIGLVERNKRQPQSL